MSRPNVIDASASANAGQVSLLGEADPSPLAFCNASSASPFFLLCEHAGQAVPRALGGLGLPAGAIDKHIGWDIGAEALARAIADRLRCPLIIQRYSRLVMDCNRPPDTETSIPEVSDGVRVPGNIGLSASDRTLRRQAIFDPMNEAIEAVFAAHPRRAAFAIHSYTRHFQGQDRPWDAGFLTRRDPETANHLMSSIAARAPDLNLVLNQPYQIEDASDWFIPRHAEPRGIQHTLIEIRNDHLGNAASIHHWADLLAEAIQSLAEVRQ